MSRPRPREPFVWALFSSGGMVGALALPALVAILFVAVPLGWVGPIPHAELLGLVAHPLTRIALFGLVTLCLFHGAHRFRYTLYDGMQLYHLNALIAVLTYGVATALTLTAAVVLWGAG